MRRWFAFFNCRLQIKVLLLLVAGLLVLLLSMAYLGYQVVQYSTDRMLDERLAVAGFVANTVDLTVHHRLRQLETLASAPLLDPRPGNTNGIAAPPPARIGDVLDGMVFTVDERAIVTLAWPPGERLIGADLGSLPELVTALREGESRAFAVQDPMFGPGPSVLLVAPIQRAGRTIGLLVNAQDASDLVWGGSFQSLRLGQTGYAEIVDDDGLVIARSEPGRPPDAREKSDHAERFQMLIQGARPVVRTCHRCHEGDTGTARRQDVLAFAPLPGLPWGVALRQSEDEALLPIWRMQSSLIIFNLLIWPAALAAAWGFTRQVVRPIGQLTAATRRIAAGELDVPMESARRDEIGQLARSFEDMRVQLQRSRQQLTQRAADLEVKTNELSALFEVSQQLASTLQMDTVLSSAIKAIRSLFPAADAGAVFLYRPEEGRLVAETCFGLDQAEAGPVSLAPGEGCAGQAFAGQRPVLREAGKRKPVTSGAGEDGPEGWSRLLADGTGLAVPLAAEGQVLGSIALYTHRRRALSLAQAPLLESLAAQATLAILNARLFQEASLAGAWQELNRLKTEFVARASHQLRTPLTVIKSFAETLLRRDVRLSASERREFLEGIDRAADRLTRLVEDLLTITRIESGRLEMRVGPVSLPAIVERVVGGYRQNTSCRLTVVVSPRMPLALADPDRVEDVLSNLISNAVKYSSPDGTITIELAPAQAGSLPASGRVPAARANAGGLVLMSVTDTGIGISAADQGRLFQPFSRIDNPVTRRIAGAGLGLYICKTYVEAMGGTIWVESEPEKRTAFRVCLPAAETADLAAGVSAAPDADRLPARRSNGLSGRRILVVDDEPDVLKAVRSSLRASGLQVLQADTAEQCFFVLETERPDLILLDVVLPDGDGFAIARSLRADPTTRQIPVVFVTARATAADEEQGRQAGAVAYLRKPFSTADLLRVVQEALSDTDSRRAGDETAGRAVESTTGQGAYPRARG